MSLEDDKNELSAIGIRFSDSFMGICRDDDPEGDPERLWKWMAELINEAYQVGWRSRHGRGPS